jgi:hypothetical protein
MRELSARWGRAHSPKINSGLLSPDAVTEV